MRTQCFVRAIVFLPRIGAEGDAHGDEAAAGGMFPVHRLVHDFDAGIQQGGGQGGFQILFGGAHCGQLEGAGELEAVIGVIGMNVHPRIMGTPERLPNP